MAKPQRVTAVLFLELSVLGGLALYGLSDSLSGLFW